MDEERSGSCEQCRKSVYVPDQSKRMMWCENGGEGMGQLMYAMSERPVVNKSYNRTTKVKVQQNGSEPLYL